jgi:hypothetical protein
MKARMISEKFIGLTAERAWILDWRRSIPAAGFMIDLLRHRLKWNERSIHLPVAMRLQSRLREENGLGIGAKASMKTAAGVGGGGWVKP